jgi:hypothetical protein
VSREMLDAEGAAAPPPASGPPTFDLDLSADPPVRTAGPAGGPAGRGSDASPDDRAPVAVPHPARRPPADPADPADPAAAAGPGGRGGHVFDADLDAEVDARAGGRAPTHPTGWAALGLTSRTGRRLTAAVAVAAIAALAAVGGYTQAQKAETRRAAASARLVVWVDENFFTDPGAAPDPVPVTVHLSVTSSVDLTVTRLVLPAGQAIPTSRVLVHPGQATVGKFLIRDACPANWQQLPQTTAASALTRAPDGRLHTVPVDLGSIGQLFGRDFLCNRNGVGPSSPDLAVDSIVAQRGGLVDVVLRSRSDHELLVTAVPATVGSAGWSLTQEPAGPLRIPANEIRDLKIRFEYAGCTPDGTILSASSLVALHLVPAHDPTSDRQLDANQLEGWDDTAVMLAAADASTRACAPRR